MDRREIFMHEDFSYRDIYRQESVRGRKQARENRDLPINAFTDMWGCVLNDYILHPIYAVLSHIWTKIVLSAPGVIYGMQILDEVRAETLAIVEVRVWAHIGVTIFVLMDMFTRSYAAMKDPADRLDPSKWAKSLGRLLMFNVIVWMMTMIANLGQPFTVAEEATFGLFLLVTFTIVMTEAWSAIKNLFGTTEAFHRFVRRVQVVQSVFSDKEISDEQMDTLSQNEK